MLLFLRGGPFAVNLPFCNEDCSTDGARTHAFTCLRITQNYCPPDIFLEIVGWVCPGDFENLNYCRLSSHKVSAKKYNAEFWRVGITPPS